MFQETSDFFNVIVQEDFNKSQVWSALTASLALLIAFRTRQALQRFWEGTTLLHQMRGPKHSRLLSTPLHLAALIIGEQPRNLQDIIDLVSYLFI